MADQKKKATAKQPSLKTPPPFISSEPVPRFNPGIDVNPKYNLWNEAKYGKYGFSPEQGGTFYVPFDDINQNLNPRVLTPAPNVGGYGKYNYKLGANEVINYMKSHPDISYPYAVGLVANKMYESGLNPSVREGQKDLSKVRPITLADMKRMASSTNKGFGEIQLTGNRLKSYFDYIGWDPKKAVQSEYQNKFLDAEAAGKIGTEKNNYAALREARNPAEGAFIAASRVERPAKQSKAFKERMAIADSVDANIVNMMNAYNAEQAAKQKSSGYNAYPESGSLWDKIVWFFNR